MRELFPSSNPLPWGGMTPESLERQPKNPSSFPSFPAFHSFISDNVGTNHLNSNFPGCGIPRENDGQPTQLEMGETSTPARSTPASSFSSQSPSSNSSTLLSSNSSFIVSRSSCCFPCCYILWIPFSREFWTSFLYFLFISLLQMTFTMVWIVVTFLLSFFFCLIFPPLGVALLTLSGYTWMSLGKMELATMNYLGDQDLHVSIHEGRSEVPSIERNKSCWKQYYSQVKKILSSSSTWLSALYFLLIKPPLTLIGFALSLSALSSSLIFVANIVLIFVETDFNWDNLETLQWIFTSPVGLVITIPISLLAFWISSIAIVYLGKFVKLVAYYFLSPLFPYHSVERV